MKLHDLKPAPGSHKRRVRVGRGIAAGKGKTAGRGTKGQKSRSGGTIPPWFEGGQTPIHVRVPKLRGFKRRDRTEYQVVNVGRIAEYANSGRFGADAGDKEPLTVNAEVLAAAGLISSPDKPIKVLGGGDVDLKLFVAADAFTASGRSKIEAAGGYVQLLAPPRQSKARASAPEADTSDATKAGAASPAAPQASAEGAAQGAPEEPAAADEVAHADDRASANVATDEAVATAGEAAADDADHAATDTSSAEEDAAASG